MINRQFNSFVRICPLRIIILGFEHNQPKKSCRTEQTGGLLQGRPEEQSRVTMYQ